MVRKWPSVNTAINLRIPKDSASFIRTKRQPDELLCHDGLVGKTFSAWNVIFSAKRQRLVRTVGNTWLCVNENSVVFMHVYAIRCLY